MAQMEMTFIGFFIYTISIIISMCIFTYLMYKNGFNDGFEKGKIEGKMIMRDLLSKKN